MDLKTKKGFFLITGTVLEDRVTNFLREQIIRRDMLFPRLARLYSTDKARFSRFSEWLNTLKDDSSETIAALSGYALYIQEDFVKACSHFLKALNLNPENLDNWIDLAFCMRHLGYTAESRTILFEYDYCIYYYKFLKLHAADLTTIKRLTKMIRKYAR